MSENYTNLEIYEAEMIFSLYSLSTYNASDVRKRFRKLTKENHPDFAKDAADKSYREQKSVEINRAYNILLDNCAEHTDCTPLTNEEAQKAPASEGSTTARTTTTSQTTTTRTAANHAARVRVENDRNNPNAGPWKDFDPTVPYDPDERDGAYYRAYRYACYNIATKYTEEEMQRFSKELEGAWFYQEALKYIEEERVARPSNRIDEKTWDLSNSYNRWLHEGDKFYGNRRLQEYYQDRLCVEIFERCPPVEIPLYLRSETEQKAAEEVMRRWKEEKYRKVAEENRKDPVNKFFRKIFGI